MNGSVLLYAVNYAKAVYRLILFMLSYSAFIKQISIEEVVTN